MPGCAVSHLLVSPCASSFESVSNEVSIETYIGTTLAFLALRSLSRPLLHAILVTRKDVSNRFKSYKLLRFLQLLQNVILVWISSKVKSGCQCPYRYGGTLVPSYSTRSLPNFSPGRKLYCWKLAKHSPDALKGL